MNKEPLTVYFSDGDEPDIYRLTMKQITIFQENDWEGIEKFKIIVSPGDVGYAPDWLVELGKIYGFEVDSI